MHWAAPLTTGNRELQKLQQEPVYIVVWCDKNLLTTLLQMVQQTISMADQMQTQRESVCASIYIFLWYGKLRQGPTWSYIGVPAGQHSGCRLATMLVATISIVIFFSVFPPVFPPSSTFLIEGVLGSKNQFRESWQERPKIYSSMTFLGDYLST